MNILYVCLHGCELILHGYKLILDFLEPVEEY